MIALSALPLAFGGFGLIGLSMDRHARQAAFRIKAKWLRPAGWALVVLSLAAVTLAPNRPIAIVEWVGIAAAAAALVVLVLYHRPRILAPLALAGAAVGALALGVSALS